MSKIAITSDCNAGLDYIGYDPQIPVLRSLINFKDEHYVDGTDIKADEFYEKLLHTDVIPSTSAPSLGEAMEMIESLIEQGYTDIIHFPISFELSGTGRTVLNLKEQYKDRINIEVFDTKTACRLQAYFALEAKRMADAGASVEEILARSEKLRENCNSYFVVDDLMYLVKNGRLSGFNGVMGTLLKIKPLLTLNCENGKILPYKKVRTHKEAIKAAIEQMRTDLKDCKKCVIFVFHTVREEEANTILEEFKKTIPGIQEITLNTVTPAVGAHIGTGIIGMGYFKLDFE